MFVVSGDVFSTLSFYLRTLRIMSRFDWGERVVVIKKKNHLAKLFLLGWQSKGEF
jgi:hypothetical protein